MADRILMKLLIIPGILLGLTFHEFAHAIIADRLGDKTPRFQGRLTLNPFVHMDPLGFIMIILVGFGWAKPVETNPSAFKNYYKDDLKVSLAGPIANLLLALVLAIVTGLYVKGIYAMGNAASFKGLSSVLSIIYTILYLAVNINCVLFILNLIPIPGFDGFHILRDLFPKTFYNISGTLIRYQMVIFLLFILPIGNTSIADFVVGRPASIIFSLFMKIAKAS